MAFGKKESAAERAAEKRQEEEKRQRDRVQKVARGAQIRESQVKIDFKEQSVERQNENGDTLDLKYPRNLTLRFPMRVKKMASVSFF